MKERADYAVLSCDVDTVDRHLQGYGFSGVPPCDLVYRKAVPRALDLLDTLGVPGVFFVIARDAYSEWPLLRAMVAGGHEVASHSLTHPQPFRTLDDTALHDEVATSRTRLAAATGAEIAGFRAPAWDVDARVLAAVQQAGYRYDASIFPTPALLANRLATYWRSRRKRSIFSMDLLGHALAPISAHHVGHGANGLIEFPIAVTPWLRFPVYHTVPHLVPSLFGRALRALLRSDLPVCYEFHAADLLDFERDGVDRRMVRHPGMQIPFEQKHHTLRNVLTAIMHARRVVTFRQVLAEGAV